MSSKPIWVRRCFPKHGHCYLHFSPWRDASLINLSARLGMILRRHICSLRSHFNWFVATNVILKSPAYSLKTSIPDRLKQPKFLDDEHTESTYSLSVLINLAQMQKTFPSVLSKKFISFLCESFVNLLKGNLQSIKNSTLQFFKTKFGYFLRRESTGSKGETIWHSKKKLKLIKAFTPPVINFRLDMVQFIFVPASM